MKRTTPRRSGTVLVESAIIYPVLLLLILAIVLLGLAVFRYQQVAHISREASRWLSVHGAQYAKESGQPAATPADAYTAVIHPMATGMLESELSYSVTWDQTNSPSRSVTKMVNGMSVTSEVTNTVSVTVTYSWDTGLFGRIPVSSTSVNVMSY